MVSPMSTILVTGGAGFIGSHTVLQLLKQGFRVTIIDNLDNSVIEAVHRVRRLVGPHLSNNLTFCHGDLRNPNDLEPLFSQTKFDAVIHFAGLKGVGESVAKPRRYYDNNVVGTINLFQAMAKFNCKNMVISSSATVYGQPQQVPCVEEDLHLHAMNPYGRTKLFVEEIARDIERAEGEWRIILLRYFNPVGAHESGQIGEDPRGIPNNLMPYIHQVAVGRLPELKVYGDDYPTKDGTPIRDYIHVMDLADGHIAALRKLFATDNIGCTAYNLGTGRGTSVLEMVAAFERQHTIIRYSSFPFVSNRSPQNPMFPPRHYTTCLLLLFLVLSDLSISQSQSPSAAKRKRMKEKVRNMFYHAYDNYMTYAFPHDELKPLSKTFTNSLSELGNLKLEHLPQDYHGSALTLIESLSSLVIMGNSTEFERAVLWLSENLTFDVDARINLFECNIRVLGGLVSAHLLASDSSKKLFQGAYNNQLLVLAEDLGKRFLPAFNTPTALPYAWINLKYGVMENETTETSTSGCGSLILEMGALSKMTGDPIYESVALRALRKLWSMQSSLKLFGTTLDVATGQWIEYSSGIGAGVDSFYEYLLKAHILFGKEDFWKMFHSAYVAVQKYFRHGSWYHEADMRTGRATYWQLTSLQAFWPGLQVLIGDLSAANSSHREFFHVWKRYGVLPERYLLDHQMIHPTEKYYPLRPELAESTFYLYQATKDPWYMEVGESIVNSINLYTKVEGGFASIKDVTTMQLEDHQHSFFLAETCKYLYLLFDDSFVHENNYVFTTEGHPLPVLSNWHEELPQAYVPTNWTFVKRQPRVSRISSMSLQVCPALNLKSGQHIESACHIPDARSDFRCLTDEDCGVDATTCRRRSCSMAGYCGLWLIV